MNPVFFWIVFVVAVVLLGDSVRMRWLAAAKDAVIEHVAAEHELAVAQRDKYILKSAKAKKELSDLVVTVTPLVEKTDWMTGRWGGQFNTLVRLEKERNDRVESVRRIISNSAPVQDVIKSGGVSSLLPNVKGFSL